MPGTFQRGRDDVPVLLRPPRVALKSPYFSSVIPASAGETGLTSLHVSRGFYEDSWGTVVEWGRGHLCRREGVSLKK